MDHINNELPTCSVLTDDFNAQNGSIMILTMQMVMHVILLHHQQNMNKL